MTELRTLGQTDIKISPLGVGTWQFSGGNGLVGKYWEPPTPDQGRDIVQTAVNGGINWFDTAQAYGKGESERNLSRALQAANIAPEDIHIATKWWPVFKTASDLKNSIQARLDCLAPYPISHYIVHQPISLSSIEKEMHAMSDLMDAGKIYSVGVSNYSAKQMRKTHKALASRGYALAANQFYFSMISRHIEHTGVLETAQELGMTLIAWTPLEQGLLTGRFHQENADLSSLNWIRRRAMANSGRLERTRLLIERMKVLADKYQATVAQIALNYTVNVHGETVVAIPGVSKPSQVEQNLGALTFKLTPDEMGELTELATRK